MTSPAKTVCDAILAAVTARAATDDIVLPDRRYVSNGAPAIDCDQVTVHVQRMFSHSGDVTAQEPQILAGAAGYTLRGIQVAVTIARCTPLPKGNAAAPAAAMIDASADDVLADADMVSAALADYGRATGCNSIAWLEWIAVDPDGGFVGGQTTALVSLA